MKMNKVSTIELLGRINKKREEANCVKYLHSNLLILIRKDGKIVYESTMYNSGKKLSRMYLINEADANRLEERLAPKTFNPQADAERIVEETRTGLVVMPLAAKSDVKTMSSTEIAELTGKRHDNVLRDIKVVLDEAGIDDLKFKDSYLSAQNKELPCYRLPRRECDLVIAGYSVKYRLAIIDRWQELEKQAFQIPTSLSEALLLAGNLAAEKEALAQQVAIAQPKVEVYDKLVETGETITVTSAAKHLGVNPSTLFTWLSENKWIYKRISAGNWLPYQTKMDAGLLVLKTEYKMTSYGEIKLEQTRVTGKGLAEIVGKFER